MSYDCEFIISDKIISNDTFEILKKYVFDKDLYLLYMICIILVYVLYD